MGEAQARSVLLRRPDARTCAAAVVALVVGTALGAEAAHVQVRARAEVSAHLRRAPEGGLLLAGRLLDDGGGPVGFEAVQVALDSCIERTLQTNASGGFGLSFAPRSVERCLGVRESRSLRVTVRFGGSSRYGTATWSGEFDRARDMVDLSLRITPSEASVDDELQVAVGAAHEGSPLGGLGIRVHVDETTVASLVTATDGRARVSLPTGALGRRGDVVLRATFAGDPARNGAEARATVRIHVPSRVTLTARLDEATLLARGVVLAEERPVAGAAVELLVDGQSALTTKSDAEGAFAFDVAIRDLTTAPPGTALALRVRSTPPTAEIAAAESDVLAVSVPPPPTIPLGYYLGPLAAVVLVLLGLGLRSLGVRAVREALDGLRDATTRALRRTPTAQPLAAPNALGGGTGRGSSPPDFEVSLTVRDASTGAPVEGADVALRPAPSVALRSDALGRVRLLAVAAGVHELSVTARGYVTVRLGVGLPHHGELRDAEVALTSFRAAALSAFRGLAERRAGGALRWGYGTPREALPALRERLHAPEPALEGLVGLFERVYFGPPGEPERAWPSLEAAIVALEEES